MSENYLDKVNIDGVDCNFHDVGARSDVDDLLNNQIIATAGPSSIVSISDGAEFKARDLTVGIEPVQDLHGYDSPWPGGGGKNLFNKDTATCKAISSDGSLVDSNTRIASDYIPVNENTTYVGSTNNATYRLYYVGFYKSDKTFISRQSASSTFTTPSESRYVVVLFSNVSTSTEITLNEIGDWQIEAGNTATSYAPYSNICPISGWTGANVSVTKTNLIDPTACQIKKYISRNGTVSNSANWSVTDYILVKVGKKYTLSGVTNISGIACHVFYDRNKVFVSSVSVNAGNTLTIPQGVVYVRLSLYTETPSIAQFEIGTTATTHEDYYVGTVYPITFPSEAGTVYGGTLDVTAGLLTVTHGNIASYSGESLPGRWISSMDVYSAGGTPTTGAQVVYELATPQTYQLTPTEVSLLKGHNNIWADTGDSTLTYITDVNSLIGEVDELKSEIGTTALPTTAQTVTGAIAEHETDISSIDSAIGTTALPTTAQTITGAIAEHETDISNINSTIGTVPSGSNLQGEVDELKSDLENLNPITEAIKVALLDCFEHVAWIDEHGQDYYDALEAALYTGTGLVSISAVFTQGSAVIYPSTPLNDLKEYLVVTEYYNNGTSKTTTDYSLSGVLEVGTSTITVSKGGKTTTFTVTVSSSYWDYEWDASSGTIPEGMTGLTNNYSFSRESGAMSVNFDGTEQNTTLDFNYNGDCELEIEFKTSEYRGTSSSPIISVCSGVTNNNYIYAKCFANYVSQEYIAYRVNNEGIGIASPYDYNVWHTYNIVYKNNVFILSIDGNQIGTGSGSIVSSYQLTGFNGASWDKYFLKKIRFRRFS